MNMYVVIVLGGFDSIPLSSLEEAKEYGFETNCPYRIVNITSKQTVFEYNPFD